MDRKIILTACLLLFSVNYSNAFDLDMTVEDDIRKNYNSSKLVKDTNTSIPDENLPALPEISNYENRHAEPNQQELHDQDSVKKESVNQKEPALEIITQDFTAKGSIKISAGTSFNVVNASKITDWLGKGNTIKFYNKSPIVKRKYSIPANTAFYGEVIESHRPFVSGNGGLVVIRIRKIIYKGRSYPLNAYITRADDKMIFLNNIKGDRTYLKTMWKKGNWGRTLFGRMMSVTVNLGGDGSTLLLSPFPFAYGTICLGLNTIVSPITAFFSKGGHVSIPAGSEFRIKLLDDAFVG